MADFRRKWLTAIKDFGTDITAIDVVPDKREVIVRCVYRGIMVGTLPGRQASGKLFRTNVLIVLGIDEMGKIQRVDEYYTATLDQGRDVSEYRLVRPRKHGVEKL